MARVRERPSSAAETPESVILTINGGSSSVKFALFEADASLRQVLSGRIERIGSSPSATFFVNRGPGQPAIRRRIPAADYRRAAEWLIDWLLTKIAARPIAAVGHRIVHGGLRLIEHQRITPGVLKELKKSQDLDRAHLPREITLVETIGRRLSGVAQIACFDSVFHRDLPRVAKILPIPRAYTNAGVRRLGFHGLSYAYLLDELRRVAGKAAADGRVVLAHLGSGASLAAVRKGKPVDTSMAFTPTAGLVMGTRPGDLDPGLLVYLMRSEALGPDELDSLISERCGLLGVSQTTADMRDLLARRRADRRAEEAVALFCYQVRKWIGAYAAALDGLDTLVFSGGIGEQSAPVRRRICEGLRFLNVRIDARRNAANAGVVSTSASAVAVRVIPTDEEIVIARETRKLLEEP
jgi:acetate kinase